jgi:transposase
LPTARPARRFSTGCRIVKWRTPTKATTPMLFARNPGTRRSGQHPAQGKPEMEKLLLAAPLSQPQRHRAHVLPPQGLPAHSDALRPKRCQFPRRRLRRGNRLLLDMGPDPSDFRREALMNRDQFWLTDAQFLKIAPHLPTDTRGKERVDDRRVISGIVQVLKSGGRWVDAPPDYGPRKTLHNRYVRWAIKGVWVRLFEALAHAGGPTAQVPIDSSAVRAHRSAAGGKRGSKIRRSGAHAADARQKSMR